jgi:hypothetical protein
MTKYRIKWKAEGESLVTEAHGADDATTRARERAAADRVPLPRPRMRCEACYPRHGYVLADGIVKCCRACGGTATVEKPL